MATWNQMNLQYASSPIKQQMTLFHDHTMLIIMMITVLVGYLLISIMFNKFTNRYILEGHTLETIWTILPAIMLVFTTFWPNLSYCTSSLDFAYLNYG